MSRPRITSPRLAARRCGRRRLGKKLARMKAGEFETVRDAARAAGILPALGGERQGRLLRRPQQQRQ